MRASCPTLASIAFAALLPQTTQAGDVQTYCKHAGIRVLELKYRDRSANLSQMISTSPGAGTLADFLKRATTRSDLVAAAAEGNRTHLPESPEKQLFLKYSTRSQKLNDPGGYRNALIASAEKLLPKKLSRINWFLGLREPWVDSTSIRPAIANETGEINGAIMRGTTKLSNQKEHLEIIISNNESEPIPYLIPLLVHELQHASSYRDRYRLPKAEHLTALIIDEAKAYDLQMQAYIALVKRDPRLFCNWLYPTWAYGDLVIPLSWTMASMETEMKSGTFLFNIATRGHYASEPSLLNERQADVRPDIKSAVTALKLRYVK